MSGEGVTYLHYELHHQRSYGKAVGSLRGRSCGVVVFDYCGAAESVVCVVVQNYQRRFRIRKSVTRGGEKIMYVPCNFVLFLPKKESHHKTQFDIKVLTTLTIRPIYAPAAPRRRTR